MSSRVHNFNAGPASHPLPVLEGIQAEFLDFKGSGMSVVEVSHRSKAFEEVMEDAVARVRRLLQLDDSFHVLFLQGGASLQFAMVPMNLLPEGRAADYVNTGTWATKAIKECMIQGKTTKVIASSEDKGFSYIPREISFSADAAYVHITSNNTIKGTQWASFPETRGTPLISDMSSDIMSRPFDVSPFGLIYAGAQKNLGPAGVTLVIVRQDMLERVPENLPTMLKYTTYVAHRSMFNTPPCFGVYTIQLVLKWLEETVGGLDKMEEINGKKAALLYQTIDASEFYHGTAEAESRSVMNVTFRLPTEDLETRFVQEAFEHGLVGLKGHRSVGGCRASIYNATTLEAVTVLAGFMEEFARKNG